ncbi:MAG: hypothetical protein ACRC92_14980 [Peptostreptococcaceae bacterium]
MHKKILISIFTILAIFCSGSKSLCNDNNEGYGNEVWINNINEKDIKIKVVDMKVNKESIKIGENYEASAIISMEVVNKGTEDVELSNLDIYPYQNNKPTKYFVTTSKDNVNGFIGNLKPQEKTIVKMGVTLHNTEEPISLVFTNIEDITNEKVVKTINMK